MRERLNSADKLAAERAQAEAWLSQNRGMLRAEVSTEEVEVASGDALEVVSPDEAQERQQLADQESAGENLYGA